MKNNNNKQFKLEGMEAILLHLQLLDKGNGMETYDRLQRRDDLEANDIIKTTEMFANRNIATLIDTNYPEPFKMIYKPPFLIEIENNKCYYLYGENLQKRYEYKNIIGNEKTNEWEAPKDKENNLLLEKENMDFHKNFNV